MMKKIAFAIALLLGGAAFAQADETADSTAYAGDGLTSAAYETEGSAASAGLAAQPGATLVQASNSAPERDARGIAVISDPAVVPAGWNGTGAGTAMGGPELDAVTGETVAPDDYPACTATVTDHCLQTYEKGRR